MNNNYYIEEYNKLAQHLNEGPLPATQNLELIAILKTLYTPKEATIAAILTFKPTPFSKLIKNTIWDHKETLEILKTMSNKGLIYERITSKESYFAILPLLPGLIEIQFMTGEISPSKRQLAKLFENYYNSGIKQSVSKIKTPYSRVIPISRSIQNEQKILPYEHAEKLIKIQKYLAIATCYCRHDAELLGHGCGKPKDVCLIFGPFAEFTIAKKFAKSTNQTGALNALEKAEKAGLVHVTDNISDNVNFLCNCCGCCCFFLKTVTKFKMFKNLIASSPFLAYIDYNLCLACEECLNICQIQALSLNKKKSIVTINHDLCLGCGLCQQICPNKAITMQRHENSHPYINFESLKIALKGKNI